MALGYLTLDLSSSLMWAYFSSLLLTSALYSSRDLTSSSFSPSRFDASSRRRSMGSPRLCRATQSHSPTTGLATHVLVQRGSGSNESTMRGVP